MLNELLVGVIIKDSEYLRSHELAVGDLVELERFKTDSNLFFGRQDTGIPIVVLNLKEVEVLGAL